MSERIDSIPLFQITQSEQWELLEEKLKVVIIKPKGEINLKTEQHPLDNRFLATFHKEQKEVIIKRLREMELYAFEIPYGDNPNNPMDTPKRKTLVVPREMTELQPFVKLTGYEKVDYWLEALSREFLASFPKYPRHMTFQILELTDIMKAITGQL